MGAVRKQYLELAGEPVLLRALRPFLHRRDVEWIVVALPREDVAAPPEWLAGADPRIHLVAGGHERTDSVRAALAMVPEEADIVLVHDAARPLLDADVVERVIEGAAKGTGAVAAVPVTDTLKRVDGGGRVLETPDRGPLWRAQTPQGFPRALLVEAHRRAEADGATATDDAALVERVGGEVVVVLGSETNLKITRPSDLALARAILEGRA